MAIDHKIRDKKLQCNINREAVKVSTFSPGKLDKHEYLTGEEKLPSDQSRMIEQAKFNYTPWGKSFENQVKIIEDHGRKEVEALKVLKPEENQQYLKSIEENFPKEMKTNEIDEIKIWKEKK